MLKRMKVILRISISLGQGSLRVFLWGPSDCKIFRESLRVSESQLITYVNADNDILVSPPDLYVVIMTMTTTTTTMVITTSSLLAPLIIKL